MASRSLFDLIEPVQSMAQELITKLDERGITYLIYCTYRSPEEQAALYAQGREDINTVNNVRRKTGLHEIKEKENRIITWAKPGESFHQYGVAFDGVPTDGGKCVWSDRHPLWKIVGETGKGIGLEWAGDWSSGKREYPHFQYTGGLNLSDLKAGRVPTFKKEF
ncbi:MAG: M15 family metallopeptidase [Acholeplasmataceae bacterium]|nr:M15 family metallopeptidase [Acholeplasmataceae bacterium]